MAHNVGLLVGDAEVEAQHPERVEDKVFKLVAVHEEAAVATEEESVSALANTVQKVHNPGRLGRAVFRDGSMALVPLVVWLMFHHHFHLRSKQASKSVASHKNYRASFYGRKAPVWLSVTSRACSILLEIKLPETRTL